MTTEVIIEILPKALFSAIIRNCMEMYAQEYAREIFIGLGALIIILIILVLRLEMRLRKLLRGNTTMTIEESIAQIEGDLRTLKLFKKDMAKYLEDVEKRIGQSIQGVGTVRFNPFRGNGEGGNQSFATSFISEKGNGVVISSLYSRDHVSIFSKPLKDFKSEYELSGEEKESLAKAREMLAHK
ncbi:MAG: hypothetical protein UX89_C0015G0014 [Parcubacteria group bacterium GW2011_GWA2_47_16]|nr:MAG: hypothetical protein UX89_C0015G0014 [Parcubacteria group bacterium GW2011_GWA2_47_16]